MQLVVCGLELASQLPITSDGSVCQLETLQLLVQSCIAIIAAVACSQACKLLHCLLD